MKTSIVKYFAAAIPLIVLTHTGLVLAKTNIGGPSTLQMEPGETRTVEYTLTNEGDVPVEANVFFNDYGQLPSGEMQHIPAGSLPQSLFRIAEFENLQYVLAAGASVQVPMTISVPEDAAGGYWGVIGVETPPPPRPEGEAGVTFNVRYAMVTVVEVRGETEHFLSVDNVGTDGASKSNPLILTIRNSGNNYQRFDLSVAFEGADGSSETVESSGVVLPGLTIDFPVMVPQDLPAGPYGVFVVITYHDGMRAEAVGTITIDER